jgi:hypothetical protein
MEKIKHMHAPVAIVGIGELGGVFARAFLKSGHPVYPVTRGMEINSALDRIPSPALTLVAVGEKDLSSVLREMAPAHRQTVGLLQNELLPDAWESNGVENPTVISVWFEKKKGMDVNALRDSPVYGPQAVLIADALESIGLPCRQLSGEDELLFELVVKNVFVYMINICGLKTGGSTGALWENHTGLARLVAADIIDLQEAVTATTFPRDDLMRGVVVGIEGDPGHKCMGRSAPARLSRFIAMADKAGVPARAIRAIQAEIGAVPA